MAGLVAITAGCDAVNPVGAVFIGIIAGFVLPFAVEFFDKVLKIDDPVGAISVHGVSGATRNIVAVGLFSTSEGLFYGNGAKLLGVQAIGVLAFFAWAAGTGVILFTILKKIGILRVSARIEEEGLDIYEHGESAYN